MKIKHKGIIFERDKRLKFRLNFAGNSCNIPSKEITRLIDREDYILIKCGKETYRMEFKDPKNWMIIDISPNEAIKEKRINNAKKIR